MRGVAAGERSLAGVEPADAVATGLEKGNANVDTGVGEGVADPVNEGDDVTLGDGVGLGVGDGGTIFSHLCKGTLAPPISRASASQRA